jgi:hypothetical protein
MFCKKCGAENQENSYQCTNCGETLNQGRAEQPAVPIPNYLVQSILITIFCCLPLGIPAIVFAAQVNGKVASGDIEGALRSSGKAKVFCWWGFGVGLVVTLLYFMMIVVSGGVA